MSVKFHLHVVFPFVFESSIWKFESESHKHYHSSIIVPYIPYKSLFFLSFSPKSSFVSKIFRTFANVTQKTQHVYLNFYNGTYEYLKSLGIEEI